MPRHQPLGRPSPDEVLEGAKVTLKRDASGKLVGVPRGKEPKATTEARPEPRDAPPVPQPPRYAT